MKKLILFYFIIASLPLQAMDFSGIQVKTIRFRPSDRHIGNLNTYNSRFIESCPRTFGASFTFSGYVSQQNRNPLTAAQQREINSITAQINRIGMPSEVRAELTFRMTSHLYTYSHNFYALCASDGPSQLPQSTQEFNRRRVAIERVLLRLGYYDLKIKLISYLNSWF